MKSCPHCNRKIPSQANYCSHPDCSKPVRPPLLSWLFGRRDGVILGVVLGLLVGLLGANLFGGTGASGEPEVIEHIVRETIVVEREVTVPVEVPVEVTVPVEVNVTRVVEATAPPEPSSPTPPPEPPSPTPPPEGPSPTAPPVLGDTLVRSKDQMTMVFVPAGSFQMGSEDGASDESPIHEVALDTFWIDQTEVTNAQFAAFLNENGEGNKEEGGSTWLDVESGDVLIEQQADGTFQPKDGFADHPAIMLSWYGAQAYCAWAGGRLPTEAEWEYAARGPESLIYPWGNQFDGSLASCANSNCSDGYSRTAPVGTFPAGASWVGAYDMAGNVWEWVNDWFDADYYARSPRESPLGALVEEAGDSPRKVLRGGSWLDETRNLRGALRYFEAPANREYYAGFFAIYG